MDSRFLFLDLRQTFQFHYLPFHSTAPHSQVTHVILLPCRWQPVASPYTPYPIHPSIARREREYKIIIMMTKTPPQPQPRPILCFLTPKPFLLPSMPSLIYTCTFVIYTRLFHAIIITIIGCIQLSQYRTGRWIREDQSTRKKVCGTMLQYDKSVYGILSSKHPSSPIYHLNIINYIPLTM